SIHLRGVVLELCPPGNKYYPRAFHELAQAVGQRFKQCSTIDDLNECIQHHCEFVSLCSEGHPSRETSLNNLALPALITKPTLITSTKPSLCTKKHCTCALFLLGTYIMIFH
ncbi:hypothetical protein C8R48DRAFT_804548, partial [Suillus tomentosus]